MKHLTPPQIVAELDKYIIGQHKAKRAVAIALRNRWRRQQVPPELRDEIAPKNIIMMGPTGVGKTEIARRLAKLSEAPFLKIEASKFTEVGYVGKDVESMIRDLTELAVKMTKEEEKKKIFDKAKERAEEKILDLLLPPIERHTMSKTAGDPRESTLELMMNGEGQSKTREKFRQMLREGKLCDQEVQLTLQEQQRVLPVIEIFSPHGGAGDAMETHLREMMSNFMPKKNKNRKLKVPDAIKVLTQEEAQKLIDMDKVIELALKKVQESGIIFIDEIDKVASRASSHGPDISREGVQRDLLPIVEGSNVSTKYGMVKTDHILFIAAGAFHMTKPSDLIPELQGRFPIRVQLDSLGQKDFVRILTEPENALTKQYAALMKTEGVEIEFTPEAIEELSEMSTIVNQRTENIGARRLHTVMERLFDDVSFNAQSMGGQKVHIDKPYIQERLSDIIKDENLSRYIL